MVPDWKIFCRKKRWRPEKSDFNHFFTTGFVGKDRRAPLLLMGINTRGFFLVRGVTPHIRIKPCFLQEKP